MLLPLDNVLKSWNCFALFFLMMAVCNSRAIADTEITLLDPVANPQEEVLSFSIPVQQQATPKKIVERTVVAAQESQKIQIETLEIDPISALQGEVLAFTMPVQRQVPPPIQKPVEQVTINDSALQRVAIKNIEISLISTLNGGEDRQETNPRITDKWKQELEEINQGSSLSILFPEGVLDKENSLHLRNINDEPIVCKNDKTQSKSDITICEILEKILGIYASEGFVHHVLNNLKLENDQLTISIQEMQISPYSYRLLDEDGKELDDDTKFLKKSIICDRLESIIGKVGDPVNINQINEGFRYWKTESLVHNIEATFKTRDDSPPSKEEEEDKWKSCGEVDQANKGYLTFDILIAAKHPQQLDITFDNNAPASVGDKKFGISYRHNNLSDLGDRLDVGYTGTTTGGIKAANFNYSLPLGVKGNSLNLSFAPSWTRVTQEPFNKFDITARNQALGIEYQHSLIRKTDEELALSLGFEFQNGRTFIFNNVPVSFGNGSNDEGVTRTSTFTFGQQYIKRTPHGAWGLSSKLYFGSGLFNATANRWNEEGGIFSKWEGYLQRVQRINDKHKFAVNLQWQLTPRTLASSQQFSLGGMNSIRGYRSNARTADNGIRLSLEDYISFIDDEVGKEKIQIVPFIDLGLVWNDPSTSNGLSDQRFLFSSGISFRHYDFLGLDDLFVRLDLAYPFIKLKDRGDTLQDKGIYFLLGYTIN